MEMNIINTNVIESNTNKSINKKQKNLKNVINNFEIEITLEEDEFKRNKNSNKRIQVN